MRAFVLVGFSPRATQGVFRAMGRPELATDPRFADNAARNRHEGELRGIIADWAKTLTRADAIAALAAEGVPAGPVQTLREVLDGPHATARGLVTTGTHARLGDIPLVPQPVRFTGAPRPAGQHVPGIGEDSDTLLAGLGLTEDRIAALRDRKVIA